MTAYEVRLFFVDGTSRLLDVFVHEDAALDSATAVAASIAAMRPTTRVVEVAVTRRRDRDTLEVLHKFTLPDGAKGDQ